MARRSSSPYRDDSFPLRVITKPKRGERFQRRGEQPKPIRPTRAEGLDWRKVAPRDEIVEEGRRKRTYPKNEREKLEARAVSESVTGRASIWERITYLELAKRKVPFDFQSSFEGGRAQLGGLVADFVLLDRPLVIQVNGYFWHSTPAQRSHDAAANDRLRLYGFDVVEVWDRTLQSEEATREWFRQHVDVPLIGNPPDVARSLAGRRHDA